MVLLNGSTSEASVWYRDLDELTFRSLHGDSDLFLDFLVGELAFNLALMGSSPDLICETMGERSREYGEYRQWLPANDAGAKDTLLWEAAQHVGEPIGMNRHPSFLALFGNRLLKKLERASFYELLLGESARVRQQAIE